MVAATRAPAESILSVDRAPSRSSRSPCVNGHGEMAFHSRVVPELTVRVRAPAGHDIVHERAGVAPARCDELNA